MKPKFQKNSLKIGKWIHLKCSIILFNMDHINQALNERVITNVDGIIGADILKKGIAIIDYEKNRLYLKP